MSQHIAFQDGFQAYLNNLDHATCPYICHSKLANLWKMGWDQAWTLDKDNTKGFSWDFSDPEDYDLCTTFLDKHVDIIKNDLNLTWSVIYNNKTIRKNIIDRDTALNFAENYLKQLV